MSLKNILCVLIACAVISPAMANSKKKPIKGKVVSLTAEELVIKIKGEKKTYTISEDTTKILNKDGEEVAAGDAQFKMVVLKADPEDETKILEIKEFEAGAKGKSKGKSKSKGKKKSSDDAEE